MVTNGFYAAKDSRGNTNCGNTPRTIPPFSSVLVDSQCFASPRQQASAAKGELRAEFQVKSVNHLEKCWLFVIRLSSFPREVFVGRRQQYRRQAQRRVGCQLQNRQVWRFSGEKGPCRIV